MLSNQLIWSHTTPSNKPTTPTLVLSSKSTRKRITVWDGLLIMGLVFLFGISRPIISPILWGDNKVSILTHRYPYKTPRKIKWPYAVTRLKPTWFVCGLMSDLVIWKFRKVWPYITPNIITETRCLLKQQPWKSLHVYQFSIVYNILWYPRKLFCFDSLHCPPKVPVGDDKVSTSTHTYSHTNPWGTLTSVSCYSF